MIELRNVTKEYSKGNSALNGVSVKIERGEFVFIVGDSGSGKSTLIRLIMKELNPTEGTIIVNGQNLNRMKHRNIAKYRRGLGVVFQDFRLLRDRNIYENIAIATRCCSPPDNSFGNDLYFCARPTSESAAGTFFLITFVGVSVTRRANAIFS